MLKNMDLSPNRSQPDTLHAILHTHATPHTTYTRYTEQKDVQIFSSIFTSREMGVPVLAPGKVLDADMLDADMLVTRNALCA